MNKVRGYIFSRPFMGERVPQHVQNMVIRDYCERNNLCFLLSATEYAMTGSHLILQQVLEELVEIDGIIAYSLFQLPEDGMRRQYIYERILREGKSIYFAVEGLKARAQEEFDRIEVLWRIRLTLPYCAEVRV